MSANRSGMGPEQEDAGSWASETLPLSVRKELLERELSKLGFRKAGAQGGATPHQGGDAQVQADGAGSHPQADASEGPHGS